MKVNPKLILYIGLILLTAGLIIRYLANYPMLATILIISGVVNKVLFLLIKLKKKAYKPGKEIVALIIGVTLFFIGLHLKAIGTHNFYLYFMITGLVLKVIFVLSFIKKV